MKKNEGTVDRRVRIVLGVVLLVLGLGPMSGIWATLATVAGLAGVVTGFVGWCPAYSVVGISTCPRE